MTKIGIFTDIDSILGSILNDFKWFKRMQSYIYDTTTEHIKKLLPMM